MSDQPAELPKDFTAALPLDNIKHEAFCLRIMGMQVESIPSRADSASQLRNIQSIPQDLRPTQVAQAYTDAGYACKDENVAAISGSRLLKHVCVRARLLWLKQEQARILVERGCCSKEEVLMTLSEMMRARHIDFMTMSEDGVWMNDIGDDNLSSAAIKKIKTRIQTLSAGGSSEITTERQFDEIELESKVAVGNAMAKLMGWNEPETISNQFTGDVTIITNIPEPDPLPDHLKEDAE